MAQNQPPAPRPAPKKTPPPTPTPAPKNPAAKPAPQSAPNSASKPAPKSAPTPAPKSTPKPTPKPAPKPAPTPTPKPAPKTPAPKNDAKKPSPKNEKLKLVFAIILVLVAAAIFWQKRVGVEIVDPQTRTLKILNQEFGYQFDPAGLDAAVSPLIVYASPDAAAEFSLVKFSTAEQGGYGIRFGSSAITEIPDGALVYVEPKTQEVRVVAEEKWDKSLLNKNRENDLKLAQLLIRAGFTGDE